MPQFYKGRFTPKNPQKYIGNPTNITYRSLWELKAMKHFDEHPDILAWQSEETIVPYISPIDKERHRYYPDFLIKVKERDGRISIRMLEVKPLAQTKPPVVKKKNAKPTKKYITEVMRWGVNEAKWDAAREYCKERGWSFHLITEKDLGLSK